MDLVDRLEAYNPQTVWILELVLVVILVRVFFVLHTLELEQFRERLSLVFKTEKEVKIIEEEKKAELVTPLPVICLWVLLTISQVRSGYCPSTKLRYQDSTSQSSKTFQAKVPSYHGYRERHAQRHHLNRSSLSKAYGTPQAAGSRPPRAHSWCS